MKRVLILVTALVAVAVLAPTATASGKQVTIYNDSRVNVIPWYPAYFPNGCRCQMLFGQAKINYAGTINEFELQKSDTSTASVTNVRFYLCHTRLTALTSNFQNNYAGNTPVLVASYANYTVPARAGFYPIPMTSTFTYNNRDNLIVEVRFDKITGSSCGVVHGVQTGYRCWARSPTATTGTPSNVAYNARISFSYYSAVSPTSLGRVKTLFR